MKEALWVSATSQVLPKSKELRVTASPRTLLGLQASKDFHDGTQKCQRGYASCSLGWALLFPECKLHTPGGDVVTAWVSQSPLLKPNIFREST